jgi:hypothetical protein
VAGIIGGYFDANWVDVGAYLGGVAYAIRKYLTVQPRRPKFLCAQAGLDFADGTALFPLGVLALAAFSTWLVTQLLSASRITLSVAGVFALLALLEQ